MTENGRSNRDRLRVLRVVDVPLREVSGICLRRSRNGRMSLIAVGDRVATIAWFSANDQSLAESLPMSLTLGAKRRRPLRALA